MSSANQTLLMIIGTLFGGLLLSGTLYFIQRKIENIIRIRRDQKLNKEAEIQYATNIKTTTNTSTIFSPPTNTSTIFSPPKETIDQNVLKDNTRAIDL
jgi:hypothetical protein